MIVGDVLTWWYTEGWRGRLKDSEEQLKATIDYFSIDLLLKTLFAPFRQISAGQVRGSLDIQIRAFFDRLVSRCIGAAVRLIVMGVGVMAIALHVLIGGLLLLLWALVPLLPLIGLGLFIVGWVPWSR